MRLTANKRGTLRYRNILAAGHAVLACGGAVQSGRPMKQEPGTARAAITQ